MVLSLMQFPGLPRVFCAFTGRGTGGLAQAGNISFQTGDDPGQVLASRRQLAAVLRPMGLEALSECHQVHGQQVLIDPEPVPPGASPAALPVADGMITARKGLGLLIKTADCQPVLAVHESGKYLLALHVGWRGNRANFIGAAVKTFCDAYDIAPLELFAVRGPSLGPAAAEFVNFAEEWGPAYLPWFNCRTGCMDLWALSRYQLEEAGVRGDRIYSLDICTALNSNAWFSYRRDNACGRQASLIWIAA